jgi:hypothetical protein
MKSAITSDLLKLKKRFEAWRKTRAKRSKTPDCLLKAAAALLDHYSASMICGVCGINLRTLRRRSSSKTSTRRAPISPVTGGESIPPFSLRRLALAPLLPLPREGNSRANTQPH